MDGNKIVEVCWQIWMWVCYLTFLFYNIFKNICFIGRGLFVHYFVSFIHNNQLRQLSSTCLGAYGSTSVMLKKKIQFKFSPVGAKTGKKKLSFLPKKGSVLTFVPHNYHFYRSKVFLSTFVRRLFARLPVQTHNGQFKNLSVSVYFKKLLKLLLRIKWFQKVNPDFIEFCAMM